MQITGAKRKFYKYIESLSMYQQKLYEFQISYLLYKNLYMYIIHNSLKKEHSWVERSL